MPFDDLIGPLGTDDFIIDPEDIVDVTTSEDWDTGNEEDIFSSGIRPDIFSTND